MDVVNMTQEHLPFVARCTHIDEIHEEWEPVLPLREHWLTKTPGLIVKVVIDDGAPAGFAHCLPIEAGDWSMTGADVMTIPCLTLVYRQVYERKRGSGYGRALMEAVEAEARRAHKKGVAVTAYDNDFWFMPASFFRALGYGEARRQGETVIMLKAFAPVAAPQLRKLHYRPQRVPGKVVVDAFWNPMCLTSLIEMQRIREVCGEFGDDVVLHEFDSGQRRILETYHTARAIFINGQPKGWGYEAPRDGLRKEIEQAMQQG